MLSYEAVFLYCLGCDARWVSGPDETAPRCCRLRPLRLSGEDDETLGRFCASFGLMLARIKLEDDVVDDQSWTSRLTLRLFGRRFEAAMAFFDTLDLSFRNDVDCIIRDHGSIESRRGLASLAEFSAPTAAGFARSFGLLANLFDGRLERELGSLGADIGRSLIAYDCAVDWEADRRRGNYNPIRSPRERNEAIETAQRHLCSAGWACYELFGANALTPKILRRVVERIANRQRTFGRQAPVVPVTGWRRRLLVRRGDCDCGGCDCLCDGMGDAGGGCCDAKAAACCDDNCGDVVCCPCDACCWDCGGRRKAKPDAAATTTTTVVGMQGKTVGPLNPMGIVRVGSKNLPAKSEGQWIPDGQAVLVIKEDSFGLTVRPMGSEAST